MNQLLRTLLSTIKKEYRILKRNKPKVGMVILSPLMFWAGISLLMGGVYAQGIEAGLVVLENDPGYYTNGLIDILGTPDDIPPSLVLLPMDQDTALSKFDEGTIMLVIVIPNGFEDALASNQSTSIEIWVNNQHEDMTKNLRMPVIRKLDVFYQTYLQEDAQVDFDYELLRPNTYSRLGYMAWTMSIYALMFGAMFAGASTVTQEFENSTFAELELANQSPIAIYAGKILVGASVGFVGPPVLFGIALLGFSMWPAGNLLLYLALAIPMALIASAVGVLLGAFARNSVYIVPLAALSSLFYWIMGGGMAPLLLAGLSFEVVDSYSPFSNAYRSLTDMLMNGIYTTLGVDLLVLGIFTILAMVLFPLLADRLARIKFPDISTMRERRHS